MSTQERPTGTMGHVHGMAASVHEHTTERGSTFPRLLLSVDYRDGNHIRLRAYVPTGEEAPELAGYRVADTLGANDIAEAVLLAGFTMRYGETMHARPMRQRIAKSGSRGAANGVDRAIAAMANTMKASSATGVPVTGPNIAAVRAALGGRSPADALGVDVSELNDYAQERAQAPELKKQLTKALRRFRDAAGLDPDTYYGTKLARMIVALAEADSAV